MRFFNNLRGLIIKTPNKITRGELDHRRILKDSNEVRQMLCQKLLFGGKTPEERNNAKKLLKEAKLAREFIPITIAKRRLYNP